MPKLSIVVTYRNRNVERVQRFLASLDAQTFQDFELVFVDYGSDQHYAQVVEAIAREYTWCRYIYNDTRGMLWNKSHAINSGVKLTSGEYFLSTDIDLVYAREVLENAMSQIDHTKQLFSLAFMLPETFTEFDTLENTRPTGFEESPYQSIGMFHLLSNEIFQNQLGGLDEFYCIWGREDTDGYVRGRNAGLESYWLDNHKFPLYHQWHPTLTATNPQFIKLWWEDIVIHFEMKRDEINRGQTVWGRWLKSEERKTIHDTPYTTMKLPKRMNPFERSRAMADVIQFLKDNSGKVLQVRIPKEPIVIQLSGRKPIHKIGFRGIRVINKMFTGLNIDLEMRAKSAAEVLTSEESMLYFVFSLIVKNDLIREYHYSEEKKHHVYKLCS